MLKVNVLKRYTINEILLHPYFTGDYTKLQKLFTINNL